MERFGAQAYGDGFAAVYDDWYGTVTDAAATAAFVDDRTDGLVVEYGVGTGRLAAPLAAHGRRVIGLDASMGMLRRAPTDRAWAAVAADMVEPPVRSGTAGCVLIGFNTLFNVASPAGQRRCLAAAASLLASGGLVIVEAFVPADDAEAGDRVDIVRLEPDRVVLRVSRTDPATGLVTGHHVDLRDGRPVRLRPWQLSFCSPADLDTRAATAGLTLVDRHADWDGTPFDSTSTGHISVYRRADGEEPGPVSHA